MKKATKALFVLGIIIFILGFMYDMKYAGIPYQDPPPELLKQYNKDLHIADTIMNSGFIVILISFILLIIFFIRKLFIKINNP